MRLSFLVLIGLLTYNSGYGKSPPKQIGEMAPDFELHQLDNQKNFKLSDYKGKVILIDFWASWCAPCKESLPELEKLSLNNKDIIVLAINIDDKKKKALQFHKERKGIKGNTIFLYDSKKDVVKDYDIMGMPSAFVIDKKGILQKRFDGYSFSQMKAIDKEVQKWK